MQSYTSLWVHLVWSTKNRQPLIHLQLKKPLYDRMREIADEKDFRIDFINGIEDHVHLLVSLKSTQSVCTVVKDLKGITSIWVNQNNLTEAYFEWQDGYAAFSVSYSQLNRVRSYIKNQRKHHLTEGFDKEMRRFNELNQLRKKDQS